MPEPKSDVEEQWPAYYLRTCETPLSKPGVMKEADMYATIRSYSGGDLADVLAAREDEIKEVIGSIDGFRSYHAVRTADGTMRSASSMTRRALRRQPARRRPGSRRTFQMPRSVLRR